MLLCLKYQFEMEESIYFVANAISLKHLKKDMPIFGVVVFQDAWSSMPSKQGLSFYLCQCTSQAELMLKMSQSNRINFSDVIIPTLFVCSL